MKIDAAIGLLLLGVSQLGQFAAHNGLQAECGGRCESHLFHKYTCDRNDTGGKLRDESSLCGRDLDGRGTSRDGLWLVDRILCYRLTRLEQKYKSRWSIPQKPGTLKSLPTGSA